MIGYKATDKDGYEQGFKDGYKRCNKDNEVYMANLTSKIIELEKENAELKKRVEELELVIQIDNRLEIEKLKAQIEKMKCCSNCANGLRNGLLCDRQIECRKNNNKLWELAE